MAESSTEIKILLESLLKRVESGQLTADKHVKAQLAFNEQLLEEPPPPAAPDQECCVLSTHTVSGGEAPRTIRLRALMGNQVMLLLVDSGSTHNFISASFVQRIAAKSAPMPPVEVRVANVDRIVTKLFEAFNGGYKGTHSPPTCACSSSAPMMGCWAWIGSNNSAP